jgi:hypothetical protein
LLQVQQQQQQQQQGLGDGQLMGFNQHHHHIAVQGAGEVQGLGVLQMYCVCCRAILNHLLEPT